MPSRYWVAVAGLIAVAVAASLWFGGSSVAPAPLLFDTPADPNQSITVHIAGEVVGPGLVEVGAGARVADAVAAAGGSTRNADLARVNLAAKVRDGEQIVIPGQSSGAEPGAVSDDGLVRINVANAGELEELPGVGPVLAGRIAGYRDEHGPFRVAEDLLDVPGIGEGKLATLRDSVALP